MRETFAQVVNEFKKEIVKYFPDIAEELELVVAIHTSLNIKEISQPVCIFLMGPPASGKTTTLELIKPLDDVRFFKLKPPKSLGFEWVKKNILPIIEIYQKNSINDILNTYTIFIAKHISYALNGRKEVLVTGGGAYNSFLIEQIKKRTSCIISIPEKQIINFKEAIIFAFLGLLRDKKQINCYSSVTGAKKNHSSGNIFLP